MKLVVGLGNPGKDYAGARHNAGFWFLDRLADAARATFKSEPKLYGRVGRIASGREEVWLLKPQTYMNASGRSVAALARFYKIAPEEILVAHDELDLLPGTVRLKLGGGVNGHNGLKDIAAHLGSHDFWRLRVGIGHPGDKDVVADYVLNPPRKEEQELLDQAISRALEVWPLIAEGNCQAAMLKLHTQKAAPAA